MRSRRRKAAPPSDEFLRVVKASARQPDASEDAEAADADSADAGPDTRDAGHQGGQEGDLVSQVRAEGERRLAAARTAIEEERERREALERELEAARAAGTGAGDDDEELDRRRNEVAEAERQLREERESWEATAERQAERRARELAEAERRIAEARHAELPADADPASGPQAANGRVEPDAGKWRWAGLRKGRDAADVRACSVCTRRREAGQEAEGDEWVITSQAAVCGSCRADGWTIPKGGRLPVRRAR